MLKDALLPYYTLVKLRVEIELLEARFGRTYIPPEGSDAEDESTHFHFDKWCHIWDNCEDHRWLETKKRAELSCNKKEFAASIACIFVSTYNYTNFPPINLLPYDVRKQIDVYKCVETILLVDRLSIDCLKCLKTF